MEGDLAMGSPLLLERSLRSVEDAGVAGTDSKSSAYDSDAEGTPDTPSDSNLTL